jgi:hypothetical protein
MSSQQLISLKGRALKIKLISQVSFMVVVFIFDQSKNIFYFRIEGFAAKEVRSTQT